MAALGLLGTQARAWALHAMPSLTAVVVATAAWAVAAGAVDTTTAPLLICVSAVLAMLAALSAVPHDGALSNDGPPAHLMRRGKVAFAQPIVDIALLVRRLNAEPDRNPDQEHQERLSLVVALYVHGFNLLLMLAVVFALEQWRAKFWRTVRGFLAATGCNSLCSALYVRSRGGLVVPGPTGVSSFPSSAIVSAVFIILAAGLRPSIRRRVLEAWTTVPLSATSIAALSDSPPRRPFSKNSQNQQTPAHQLAAAAEPDMETDSQNQQTPAHQLAAAAEPDMETDSHSLGSTFVKEDTDRYLDLHNL